MSAPVARGPGALVLLRHGKSEWNESGQFTGWTDVDLSPAGEAEAAAVGAELAQAGYAFDRCFTSVLRRAVHTADIVLRTMGQADIPVERSWRLNERHYGALQGLGFWAAVRRFGLWPVVRCQREFAYAPPRLDAGDPRQVGHDERYAELNGAEVPRGESLRDALARVLPYWQAHILPAIERGERVLVVSHKNALRGLVKQIEGRGDAEVKRIRIPTCAPIVYARCPVQGLARCASPGGR